MSRKLTKRKVRRFFKQISLFLGRFSWLRVEDEYVRTLVVIAELFFSWIFIFLLMVMRLWPFSSQATIVDFLYTFPYTFVFFLLIFISIRIITYPFKVIIRLWKNLEEGDEEEEEKGKKKNIFPSAFTGHDGGLIEIIDDDSSFLPIKKKRGD